MDYFPPEIVRIDRIIATAKKKPNLLSCCEEDRVQYYRNNSYTSPDFLPKFL